MGGSLVVAPSELWKSPAYWCGYAVVFSIKVLTVFVNDLYDFESDRRNENHGPFTGGARVLVEGLLTKQDLCIGCKVAVFALLVAAALLAFISTVTVASVLFIGTALVLGVGYTMPPMKFSHRGWGEVVVAFVHSLFIVPRGH
ncbi:MAG: hypothetical protein EOP84_22115 [Verrucomicrobiaceae bacterium]|nr:MAG: hypothetical protein EOP84_22115 [Verrucomicrobiaceae bacterium]